MYKLLCSIPIANTAASIIRDAGGMIIGNTRLQRSVYLLEAAIFGYGFNFDNNIFSRDLDNAINLAYYMDLINITEFTTSWDSLCPIYLSSAHNNVMGPRIDLLRKAIWSDPVELDLAVTALYLFKQGYIKPWKETYLRKTINSRNGRLKRAKILYNSFREIINTLPILKDAQDYKC